jgi:DNA-binding NarL/FixJ family response regulator
VSLIRTAILGDNRLFRQGLKRLLASDPSLVVVGEGDRVALDEFLRDPTLDILLTDTWIDGNPAPSAEHRRIGSRPCLILLAAEADDDWAVRALKAGARGILVKSAGAEELIKAIRVVYEGQIWARRRVLARIVEEMATLGETSRPACAFPDQRLTRREQEVVHSTTGGLSNAEIADRLGISEATVKAHLTKVFQKLGLRDRLQLATLHQRFVTPNLATAIASRVPRERPA